MRKKIVKKRVSGCVSASTGGCGGPIVALSIMKIGNLRIENEVCEAHALNYKMVLPTLVSQGTRKLMTGFGIRPPSLMPKFEFQFLSTKERQQKR